MILRFVAKFKFYVAGSLALFSVACSTSTDHKWLVYNKDQQSYKLRGHVSTTKQDLDDYKKEIVQSGKPIFDENDRVHVMFPDDSESRTIKKCVVEEKYVGQKVDSPVAPPAPRQLVTSQQLLSLSAIQIAAFTPEQIRTLSPTQIARLTEVQIKALSPEQIQAMSAAQTAAFTPDQINMLSPDQIRALPIRDETFIACDLDLTNKGGFQVTYKLVKEDRNTEKSVLEDTIIAHELYRFRVIAAPVWTTLQKRDKKYSLKTNSAGQSEVAATARQDHPANYTLMLQAYWWKPRDVLDPPRWPSWRDWKDSKSYADFLQDFGDIVAQKVNPVIGINLINPNPLNHFYVGLSLETYPGFDIVAGAHWAKTEQLTAGFAQGQITTIPPATKERFNNGWFVGVGVDIGVMATWLKYIGQAIPSLQ